MQSNVGREKTRRIRSRNREWDEDAGARKKPKSLRERRGGRTRMDLPIEEDCRD